MKTLKRISLTTLVLVMVLTTLLAIPASAYVYEDSDINYFTKPCNTAVFVGYGYAEVEAGGSEASASTKFSHDDNLHSSSATAYT